MNDATEDRLPKSTTTNIQSGYERTARHSCSTFRVSIALMSCILPGCSTQLPLKPPAIPVEGNYGTNPKLAQPVVAGEPIQRIVIGGKLSADWWTLFHSKQLEKVVKLALAKNPDLAAAEANLKAAQEVAKAARGALFPRIDFSADAQRQRQNFASFGLKYPPTTFNNFSVGTTVNYSLDVFGRNRYQIEKRVAQADVQMYQRDAVYLSLTGNVITDAIQIASLRAQIKAYGQIFACDRRTLSLTRQRVSVGVVSEARVAEAETKLASDRMALPVLRQRLSAVRHDLSVLVGNPPAQWKPPQFSLSHFQLPTDLPSALPSQLVRRRPDILAAEAELRAASATVGVATANLYPDITITGGIAQSGAASLLNWPATVWSVGGGLVAPIFNGGALTAQRRAAKDSYIAASETYQRVILNAFAQVADILDALQHDTELLSDSDVMLNAANHTLTIAQHNYQVGNVGLLNLLSAQRHQQRALLAHIRAKSQRYSDSAALFLAMGGGWWKQPGLKSAAVNEIGVASHGALQ